jgi:hypothetical protein
MSYFFTNALALITIVGFVPPTTRNDNEACRAVELSIPIHQNLHGFFGSRDLCAVRHSNGSDIYETIGCVKKGGAIICEGYNIQIPCDGCVYSGTHYRSELTEEFNKIKNQLIDQD